MQDKSNIVQKMQYCSGIYRQAGQQRGAEASRWIDAHPWSGHGMKADAGIKMEGRLQLQSEDLWN